LAFSYWIDIPWFLTKGKLAAIFIKPSLGVSQLGGHLHPQHRATNDQDCDGAYHLKFFFITYQLEDDQELSLGMLDTSQTYL
jgi:hypothetical protein